MSRRQVQPLKWETALSRIVNDFKKVSTLSKVLVLGLLIFFVVVAVKQFDGYEFYVNQDADGDWIRETYVHIRLYSWWGLREKFFDVQKRPVPGEEDWVAWCVKESGKDDASWKKLFLLMGEYDEVGLNIGF